MVTRPRPKQSTLTAWTSRLRTRKSRMTAAPNVDSTPIKPSAKPRSGRPAKSAVQAADISISPTATPGQLPDPLSALEALVESIAQDEEDLKVGIAIPMKRNGKRKNNRTTHFRGMIDTGARGMSLVQTQVLDRINEHYIAMEDLPEECQRHADGVSAKVKILGVVALNYVVNKDGGRLPGLRTNAFWVVATPGPDEEGARFDFVLGTDWTQAIKAQLRATKERLSKTRPIPDFIHFSTAETASAMMLTVCMAKKKS